MYVFNQMLFISAKYHSMIDSTKTKLNFQTVHMIDSEPDCIYGILLNYGLSY